MSVQVSPDLLANACRVLFPTKRDAKDRTVWTSWCNASGDILVRVVHEVRPRAWKGDDWEWVPRDSFTSSLPRFSLYSHERVFEHLRYMEGIVRPAHVPFRIQPKEVARKLERRLLRSHTRGLLALLRVKLTP